LNSVTKAVNDPRKLVLAAMNFSKRALRALPRLIHNGSDGLAKGLHAKGLDAKGLRFPKAMAPPSRPPNSPVSRDFAAVMAQTPELPRICYFVHIFNQISLGQLPFLVPQPHSEIALQSQ